MNVSIWMNNADTVYVLASSDSRNYSYEKE